LKLDLGRYLKSKKETFRNQYGVTTLGLYGSYARDEESKKIDESLKNDIEIKIKWKNIAGIRDKISHNYRGVNEDVLWSIIHSDLYDVKNALIEMITLLNPPKEALNEFLDSIYYKHLQYLRNIPNSETLEAMRDIKSDKNYETITLNDLKR